MRRAPLGFFLLALACTPTGKAVGDGERRAAKADAASMTSTEGTAPAADPTPPVAGQPATQSAGASALDHAPEVPGGDEPASALAPEPADPPWPVVESTVTTLTPAQLKSACDIKPGKLEVRPKDSGEGALPFVPRTDGDHSSNMDHLERFGWSADGAEFVYCQPVSGAGCPSCVFTALDGTSVLLNAAHDDASGEADANAEGDAVGDAADERRLEEEDECSKKKQQALDDRLKAARLIKPNPRWARGGSEILVWRQQEGDWEEEPAKVWISMLARADASLPKEARRAKETLLVEHAIHEFGEVHPEVIVPSPDGRKLAVMTHGYAGEYSDTMHLWIFDIAPKSAVCP